MNAICEHQEGLLLDSEACYDALGFTMAPFSITPDTEFLVPQRQYLEAIASLRYGLASGSFTLLTGNVGLGKTLLCRYLMQNMPAMVRTAYIFNPRQSYSDFLTSLLQDLTGRALRRRVSCSRLHDYVFRVLASYARHGRRVALLIDEAHLLQAEVLEGLRLLSNLETEKRKLLSLLLVGQNELEHTLSQDRMRALRQRISVWCRLRPFTLRESVNYIRHRLVTAGIAADCTISTSACLVAHVYSRGVPRRLNQICDRALLGAFASYRSGVDAPLMQRAAREVIAIEGV